MRFEIKIIRKKFFKILLSMIIIISLGVALLFGLENGVLSLNKSVDKFIKENNYPDIKIETEVEDLEKIKKLDEKEFKNIEYRLSMSTILKKDKDVLSIKLSTYEDKDLNDFYVYKNKKNNSKYYDIFVERRFASNNSIKLGDILKVKVGDKFYNFYVSKIISIPEAIVSAPINGIWGEINNYGNLYINRKILYEETNKEKEKLLKEIIKKEKEIKDEEEKKLEEYNKAKRKIEESLRDYNNQKNNYNQIKNELDIKLIELNNNKEKIIEIKKEYINIMNSINKYEKIIDTYIQNYSELSSNYKDYIEKIIEEKYPNLEEDDLELIVNISYYILQGKIDSLIGSDRENIKIIVHNILDDNIKLDKLKPYYGEIVKIIDKTKDIIQNNIDNIYNSSRVAFEKSRLINSLLFNYIRDVIDEGMVSILSEYKDTKLKSPLLIIEEILIELDSGINSINNKKNSIIDELNKAIVLIHSNSYLLDDTYNTFKSEIAKIKKELNDKKNEINKIKGYEDSFNEILICLNDSNKKEEILEDIKDKNSSNLKIVDSYTYEKSPVYNHININLDVMRKISFVIPVIFYLIILVVLYFFVTLMIKQSKKEIAILMLLGKEQNHIRLSFCMNNIIVSIIGIVLGIIIGFFPMIYMVEYFKNFFLLPSTIYEIDFSSILICSIVTILVVEIATLLATRELNRIMPVELLKREEFYNRKISKIMIFITSIFRPFTKFSFLVYFRNRRKLILGILCTSMTVSMIFSSLSYIASKNKIFNNYFDNQIHYDAQIFKKGEIKKKEIEDLRKESYVKNADLLRYFNVKVKNYNKEYDLVINAVLNNNNYIKIFDKNNKEIKYPDHGIVLEEHIANELGLKINDTINISGIDFKIVDISFQSIGRINYISLEDSYQLKSTFDSIVLNIDSNYRRQLINKVSLDNNYIYTVFNDELRDYNKKIFDSYTIPSIIIIIFTLIIGFIIIININLYNLLNQKRNLAIFRSLGFQYSEISRNWFLQSFLQWIISLIIGIPCGILLSKYFLYRVSSPRREFIYASGLFEYIVTMILLFLYIYIGHRKTIHIFKKMDIVEEVKDRD